MLSDAAISRFLSRRNAESEVVPDRGVAVESRVSNWISGVRGGSDASSASRRNLSDVQKKATRRQGPVRQQVLPSDQETVGKLSK